jgi:Protein of unknown function (DUF2510)
MSNELAGWHPDPTTQTSELRHADGNQQWTASPTTPQAMPPQPAPGPAGWHPDPSGTPNLRYFDGQQWTAHTAPQPMPTYHAPASGVGVAVAVANGGGPNHALHAVLTLLTCGAWPPVWILIAIFGGRGNSSAVSVSR